MTHKIWVLLAGLAASTAGGCTEIGQDGCASNSQCKGSRVCMRNVCMEPRAANYTSGLEASDPAADQSTPEPGQHEGSEPDAGPTAMAGMAGMAGMAPVDAGPPSDDGARPSDVEYICIVGGEGACQNTTDCPSIEDGSAKATAKECGVECATSLNPDCAGECIQSRSTLTPDCSGCLEAFFDCLLAECLAPCVSGTAEECGDCSREKPAGNSCSDQLSACSGIELNPDYVAP